MNDPTEASETGRIKKRRLPILPPHLHLRGRVWLPIDSPAGPPPLLPRFRKWYSGGFFGRRDGWVSPIDGGLNGFAWRTEVDAFRDAAHRVPDGSWGAGLPHAVTAVREVAEGEMASIGVAWQSERPKYDKRVILKGQRVAASKHALERAEVDEQRMEDQLFLGPSSTGAGTASHGGGQQKSSSHARDSAPDDVQSGVQQNDDHLGYPGYLAFLDRKFKDEHFTRGVTKDDYLRIYDTRFSTRTLGYWAVIAALTVAEFPLNEKVFTQLGDTGLAYIIAAGLGITLITAAHFVGVTFRRFADIRAARNALFAEADDTPEDDPNYPAAKKRLADYTNPARRTHRGLFRAMRDLFVTRQLEREELECEEHRLEDRERTAHLRSSARIAVFITALVIVSAMFLGYARAGLVENQQQSQAQNAGQNALANCLFANQFHGGTQNCQAAQQQAIAQKKAGQITQSRALSTVQYGLLQILIFFVAAAVTFSYYNEVVAAVRQARARLNYLRRRQRRAMPRLRAPRSAPEQGDRHALGTL